MRNRIAVRSMAAAVSKGPMGGQKEQRYDGHVVGALVLHIHVHERMD